MEVRLKSITVKTEQVLDRSLEFKNVSPYRKVISGTLETDVKIETTLGTIINPQSFDIEKLPPLMVESLLKIYSDIEIYMENAVIVKDDMLDENLDDRDIVIKKNENPNFEYMAIIDPEANEKKRVDALNKIKPLMSIPNQNKNTVKPIAKSFLSLTEEEKNQLYAKIEESKKDRISTTL